MLGAGISFSLLNLLSIITYLYEESKIPKDQDQEQSQTEYKIPTALIVFTTTFGLAVLIPFVIPAVMNAITIGAISGTYDSTQNVENISFRKPGNGRVDYLLMEAEGSPTARNVEIESISYNIGDDGKNNRTGIIDTISNPNTMYNRAEYVDFSLKSGRETIATVCANAKKQNNSTVESIDLELRAQNQISGIKYVTRRTFEEIDLEGNVTAGSISCTSYFG